MRRALQPSGRVAFVCWRGAAENDWMRLPMGAIKGIVLPTARPDPEAAARRGSSWRAIRQADRD